jgi:hypothetical protein
MDASGHAQLRVCVVLIFFWSRRETWAVCAPRSPREVRFASMFIASAHFCTAHGRFSVEIVLVFWCVTRANASCITACTTQKKYMKKDVSSTSFRMDVSFLCKKSSLNAVRWERGTQRSTICRYNTHTCECRSVSVHVCVRIRIRVATCSMYFLCIVMLNISVLY